MKGIVNFTIDVQINNSLRRSIMTDTEEKPQIPENATKAAAKGVPEPEQTMPKFPAKPLINPPKSTRLKASPQSSGAQAESPAFIDNVYQQINAVIGGNDPNQFLCLTIPGQALSAEDFTYDYKNNSPKGPTVEANESRLVNKLFDPCRMTGSDNGLTLPYQYRSALDMLTPKLNAKIANAKNELRQLLLTDYPYDFGDGADKKYTLQEVFFRLYDEWVDANEKWSELMNEKKDELRKLYPGTDLQSNTKYNDAYLEWYETVAESYLTAINEKMSKVLSVFSPNDMKILEGILDSGSGAELEQARQTLQNTQKLTPDGGYVYPVKLNPTSWFELLSTSFTPVDLLKTPDVLATQLQTLSTRRLSLSTQINDISTLIPDQKTLESLSEQVKTAQDNLSQAKSDLIKTYGDGINSVINAALDVAPLFTGGVPLNILNKLGSKAELPSGKTIQDLVSGLTSTITAASDAQQKYIDATQQVADAAAAAIRSQNLSQLGAMLSPLKEELDKIDLQISDIQAQIQLSSAIKPAPDENGKVTDSDTSSSAVTPPDVPEGYMQIVITAEASTLDKSTSQRASASASTSGAGFWFCGYESQKSTSSSSYSSFTSQSDSSIQIGMNIAKVGIEREWFNPGVFALSKDMFNVTTLRISPNPTNPYTEMSDNRLGDMASNNMIFPCYPVAMVIARDISIKLVSGSSISSSFADSVESHASRGGGFLFFSGSSSSSSSSSDSGVHSEATSNTVTLKFDTPQIIGYYLEATPADKSALLDDVSGDEQAGYVTISQFVANYRKILKEISKHNTNTELKN